MWCTGAAQRVKTMLCGVQRRHSWQKCAAFNHLLHIQSNCSVEQVQVWMGIRQRPRESRHMQLWGRGYEPCLVYMRRRAGPCA